MSTAAVQNTDEGFQVTAHDMIPMLEIDYVIKDAKDLYARRGPVMYMSTPWWEKTNRHLLINHLCKLYEYTTKYKLSYLDAVRFNNRSAYHMYPAGRAIVRETSQSIGSTTFRAHFRTLTQQFSGRSWRDLFDLEERFWSAQKVLMGGLDSTGAITKIGSKRVYTLWESLDSIRTISTDKSMPAIDLLDFAMFHSKPCNTFKLSTQIGSALARGVPAIRALLPTIRSTQAFLLKQSAGPTSEPWTHKIGLSGARLTAGTLPLGFALAREHLGQTGKMEDIVEVAPTGQYRTKSGAIFQGEFWFQGSKNPWLVVQVGDSNASRVDFDTWYNPSRHDSLPTLEELQRLAPEGAWTKVWDRTTGRPLSAQAGRVVLKPR